MYLNFLYTLFYRAVLTLTIPLQTKMLFLVKRKQLKRFDSSFASDDAIYKVLLPGWPTF